MQTESEVLLLALRFAFVADPVPPFPQPLSVVRLSKSLDAVLDLVEATTDALAALEVKEASERGDFCFPSARR